MSTDYEYHYCENGRMDESANQHWARIRAERKAKNYSQADLERRCGLPRCRISWLGHGKAVPTLETLEKIADGLGIPVHVLLMEERDGRVGRRG